MPTYIYKTEDGEEVSRLFKYSERPQEIVLPDGRVAKYNISTVQRTTNGWATFQYGVSGEWNPTLGARITSQKQHDELCKKKNIHRINEGDLDRIERGKSKRDDKALKVMKELETYDNNLKKTGDKRVAYDMTYGEEDRKVAEQAHKSDILERIPQAKYIDFDKLGAK